MDVMYARLAFTVFAFHIILYPASLVFIVHMEEWSIYCYVPVGVEYHLEMYGKIIIETWKSFDREHSDDGWGFIWCKSRDAALRLKFTEAKYVSKK